MKTLPFLPTVVPMLVVQSLSCVQLFATPWTAVHHGSMSITNSCSLLKLMSIESVMPSNLLVLYHPLVLLHSIFLRIRVFSNESAPCIRWPKYWSFSFSISPSNEYSTLISFRMDWLDLLVVQGTLKSLLQNHHSKASILQCSAFFMVQFSHPYMTTGKTIALTIRTFVGKVMPLTSVLSSIRPFTSWATTVCWTGPSLLTPRSVKKPKASTVRRLSTVPWSPQIHKFKRPSLGLPGGPMVGNSPCNAEDTGSIPGLGRSHMQWGN